MKKRLSADYIAKIAILSALSVVLFTWARFPIFPPPYNALDLDFSSLPVLLGGFALGPMAVVIIEIVKVVAKIAFQGLSFGGVGDLSNLIVSLGFALPAAVIYKYNHTKKGAYIGLGVAAASQVIIGALSNYFIIIPLVAKIPGMGFYMDIRADFAFLWGTLFNIIKGVSNSLLAVIFYKRLSPYLKKEYIKNKADRPQRIAPQNYQPDANKKDIEEENDGEISGSDSQAEADGIETKINEE